MNCVSPEPASRRGSSPCAVHESEFNGFRVPVLAKRSASGVRAGWQVNAAALDVHPDDLRAWTGKLAATRLCGLPEPSTPAAPPPAPGQRPGRVLAERVFQAQDDASEGGEFEEV